MSAEQVDKAIEISAKMAKLAPLFTILMVPIILLVVAGVPLLVFKMFGAEGGTFKQFFSVTLYAWTPQLIKYVITAAIVAFKQSLTVEEMKLVLKSNLAFLADMKTNPALFSILENIDVFVIWTVVLLILGFALSAKTSRGKAAAVVLSLWAVVILGGAGMALLGTMGGKG